MAAEAGVGVRGVRDYRRCKGLICGDARGSAEESGVSQSGSSGIPAAAAKASFIVHTPAERLCLSLCHRKPEILLQGLQKGL